MPDLADPPRRSGRQRKSVLPELEPQSASRRRVRNADDDQSSDESAVEEENDDADYRAGNKRKRPGTVTAPNGRAPKQRKGNNRSTKRQAIVEASQVDGPDGEAEEHEENTNHIFLAVLDPDVPIGTTVADTLDAFRRNPTGTLTDLVNFVLRSAGTKAEVTSFDIEDVETVPESLGQIQDHITGRDRDVVRVTTEAYPLVSSLKKYKNFRKTLTAFWKALIAQADDRDLVVGDAGPTFFGVLETWIVTMSSSTLRAFRHTATTIALAMTTVVVERASRAASNRAKLQAQLDKEPTRARPAAKAAKLQSAFDDATELERRLREAIDNLFDAVVVHRYRDVDPKIRAECIAELGVWMRTLPSVFYDGSYLRYLGWTLSDLVGAVRREVIKVLVDLYGMLDYVGNLRHFTSKFKPRILEIAGLDNELSVRVQAIKLADVVRRRGMLEDDEVERLLRGALDVEPRVRDAIKDIFASVLDDRETGAIDGRLAGHVEDAGSMRTAWLRPKILAEMLESIESAQSGNHSEGNVGDEIADNTALGVALDTLVRAVDGIEYATLADYLLIDNDSTGRTKSKAPHEILKAALALTPAQRRVLLEALVSCAKAETEVHGARKGKSRDDVDDAVSDETQAVSLKIIDALPRLLKKYDNASEVPIVLRLIGCCDVSLYSELRRLDDLNRLLEILTKMFLSHREPAVLRAIVGALLVFSSNDALAGPVKDQFLELQDSLRDGVIHEDPVPNLTLQRLELITSIDDCVMSFDETADGSRSVVTRMLELLDDPSGRQRALARGCLRNYFLWKIRAMTAAPHAVDEPALDLLLKQRDDVLFRLDAQVDSCRSEAALAVLDLESIFVELVALPDFDAQKARLRRPLDSSLQRLLLKMLRRHVQRAGASVDLVKWTASDAIDEEDEEMSELEEDDEEDVTAEDGEDEDADCVGGALDRLLERERQLCLLAGLIGRAVLAKKLPQQFLTIAKAYKSKLGPSYDAIVKTVLDIAAKARTSVAQP